MSTRSRATLLAEQQLRRIAARSTQQIALRRGRGLGMYLGVGYPKSGTVWLCNLLGNHLGLPYPREYQLPVMMASVVHAHWAWDERLPPAVYVRRDGRDVMVSLYFYSTRAVTMAKSPTRVRRLNQLFTHLYGPAFDPADVRGNLPRFIEHELTSPRATHGVPWHRHLDDWIGRPGVVSTSYEALLADTAGELHRVMTDLLGEEPDPVRAELAARRHEFARSTGRAAGTEDRMSFLRKGIAGDWANHFGREAGEVFDGLAGEALVRYGYAADRRWWEHL